MEFVKFTSINKGDLIELFLNDLNNEKLAKILKKNKKGTAVSFYNCEINNFYLVIVRGVHDRILVELGRKYGFPRGFPILWSPNNYIRYFGFLPKFENDKRQEEADDNLINIDIQNIRFFKKWSGFLGQLLVWEYGGMRYWTVCSKNSANYDDVIFVQEARRLFEPFITTELVNDMVNKNLHICAEMMSFNDQVHGARVLKETPIITVIGTQLQKDSNDRFIDFLSHQEVVEFCNKHNLPCDSAVIVDGVENCRSLLVKMAKERDFLTNNSFNELVESSSSIIHKGTVCHKDILGNVLEGIVMMLTTVDGKTETKKYKFPGYTIRTMLFRPEFGNTFENKGGNFVFSYALKKKAKRFVDYWCISEEGRKYWYNKALEGFVKFQMERVAFENSDDKAGIHIRLIDSICESAEIPDIDKRFNDIVGQLGSSTVIVVVGPVGSGKTSVAKFITNSKSHYSLVDIDGDDLGLGSATTLKLGGERNPFTVWRVIETLMEGKIPVLSTGGGAICNSGNVILRDSIHSVLGISVKMIVLAPNRGNDFVLVEHFSKDFKDLYEDSSLVVETVKDRVARKEWQVPDKFISKKSGVDVKKFAEKIANLSQNNQKFCEKLFEEADLIFGFPCVNRNNYKKIQALDTRMITNEISQVKPFSPEKSGRFMQLRILCQVTSDSVDFMGHITWKFDAERQLECSLLELRELTSSYNPKIGKIYTLEGKDAKNKVCKISLAIPAKTVHPDDSTHITISAGSHQPMWMKTVALAIRNGESEVELPTKNGLEKISYAIKNCSSENGCSECTIKVIGAFGI